MNSNFKNHQRSGIRFLKLNIEKFRIDNSFRYGFCWRLLKRSSKNHSFLVSDFQFLWQLPNIYSLIKIQKIHNVFHQRKCALKFLIYLLDNFKIFSISGKLLVRIFSWQRKTLVVATTWWIQKTSWHHEFDRNVSKMWQRHATDLSYRTRYKLGCSARRPYDIINADNSHIPIKKAYEQTCKKKDWTERFSKRALRAWLELKKWRDASPSFINRPETEWFTKISVVQ